nr:ATP-binding protein [Planosporangium mesophilum]
MYAVLTVVRSERLAPAVSEVPGGLRRTFGSPRRQRVVPAELPPPPGLLEGRDADIERVLDHLYRPDADDGPRLIVVHGEPGIGKTAFVTKVAHLVADAFPDGQLLVRFDARGDGLAEDPLELFVTALKGPRDEAPEASERERWYRDRTRDKRILVILDNLSDVTRIGPLLPAGPECVAIVTSTTPLRVRQRQLDVALGPLPPEAATRLLDRLLGGGRVAAEPRYASRIVTAAAGYPIAVHMAGTVLAVRKNWTLEIAVRRMREGDGGGRRGGLAPFAGVLDLAFALLTEQERSALVLLGLLDDRRVEPWMLAALFEGAFPESTGVTPAEAGRLLDRLARARFAERRVDDSSGLLMFRVPVYVHAYAGTHSARMLTPGQRDGARWALDYDRRRRAERRAEDALRETVYRYLDSGRLDDALTTARESLALARERASTLAEHEDATAGVEVGLTLAALAELYAELGWIDEGMTCVDEAKEWGWSSPHVLARALRVSGTLRQRHRLVAEATTDLLEALRYAEGADDRMEQVRVLRELASALALSSVPEEGTRYAEQARQLCADGGTPGTRHLPGVLLAGAKVLHARTAFAPASAALSEAERLTADPDIGQQLWRPWIRLEHARLLLSWGHADPGRRLTLHDQSRRLSLSALEGFTALRHRYGCGHARLALGRAYLAEGKVDKAIPVLEESRGTFRRCGDRWIEADVAVALADAYRRDGQGQLAVDLLAAAEQTFAKLGDVDSLTTVGHLLWTYESSLPPEPLIPRSAHRERESAEGPPPLASASRTVNWPLS